jgi:hypothetical protein
MLERLEFIPKSVLYLMRRHPRNSGVGVRTWWQMKSMDYHCNCFTMYSGQSFTDILSDIFHDK